MTFNTQHLKTRLSLMFYKLVYSQVTFFFKTTGTTYVDLKERKNTSIVQINNLNLLGRYWNNHT